MVGTCHHASVQVHGAYTKSQPDVNGRWVMVMGQCSFIDDSTCATLVGALAREEAAHEWGRRGWEVSVTSPALSDIKKNTFTTNTKNRRQQRARAQHERAGRKGQHRNCFQEEGEARRPRNRSSRNQWELSNPKGRQRKPSGLKAVWHGEGWRACDWSP